MTDLDVSTEPVGVALSAQDLQRATAQGALWTMVHTVVAVPIAFVANAVVARSLGPGDYGRLAVITLTMAVAVIVTNLGVSDGIQQWGASAHASGDSGRVDRLLQASLGFHLLVQLPLLVGTALILGRGQPLVVVAALVVAAILPPALGTSALCISIENLTAQASRLSMVNNFFTQAAISAVALLMHSPVAVWSTRGLIPALATPANFLLLTPHRRRIALRPRLPRGLPPGFWKFCLLTAAGGVLALLVASRSEIVVLQRFGTPAAVGVYALAFGIAVQMRGPVEALLAPLLPSIAGIVEVHPHLARTTMMRCLRVGNLLSSMLLLLVPLISAAMPFIYGREFAPAAALLPVLAVVALSQAVINPLMAFARAQKLSGALLGCSLLALGVDMSLAVLLTPGLGTWGAAIATTVAQLATIGLLAMFQVRRELLNWGQIAESCAPLVTAAVIIGVLAADRDQSLPVQAGAWLLGLAAWCLCLRLTLSTAARADLARVLPTLPKAGARVGVTLMSVLGVLPPADLADQEKEVAMLKLAEASPKDRKERGDSSAPAIVFGVLVEDDVLDWPGRNQLIFALAKHTPIVMIQRAAYTHRYLPIAPRPRIEELDDNIFVMRNAFSLRTHRVGRYFWRTSAALDGRWFGRALKDAGMGCYVMWLTVNDPVLSYGIKPDRLIYDCMDPNFLPSEQESFDRKEALIAGKARLVFASAASLFVRMQALNRNTYLLPNATIMAESPVSGAVVDRPKSLPNADRQVVGYLGTIDWRFDAEYVTAAAEALPDVTFALVGRVNKDQESKVATLRRLPNVIMPGQVDKAEGIAYTRAFDVGLIPFTSSPMNDAINPVKMYMYLAAGLPVVSTAIAECEANPFVMAARTKADFITALRASLTDNTPSAVAARLEFAAVNTWDDRARKAVEVLADNGLWTASSAATSGRRRPSVALIRGEALNPFELQAYGPLSARFDILGVGRRRPNYEVDGLAMPVTLLPSVGAYRMARALHRRKPFKTFLPQDADRLLGLTRAVRGHDILHAAETVLPVSEQAAEIASRSAAKLVLTCWETIAFRYDDDPVLAARKAKVRAAASMYIAVTERARQALLAEGVPAELIRVIPAAVDCRRFRPLDGSGAMRAGWGVPDGCPVVLYVGRLIQEKGVVELVRAFAGVDDEQAHLVLIGNGNQGDRIRISAKALGVSDRVHVRGGVSYQQVPDMYATADLVVAPSLTTPYWEEQFGMVLAETMACGKPLLTTSSGAIPEVVGEGAQLVEPYDVAGLTAALQGLLSCPSRREALGIAARSRAQSRYDIPVVAAQLANAYDDLLA